MTTHYAQAADAALADKAPPWRPEEDPKQPQQLGLEIVAMGPFEREGSAATILVGKTEFARGGPIKSRSGASGRGRPKLADPRRARRLLTQQGIQIGDRVLCTFRGRKAFSDVSGKTWLDYEFRKLEPGETSYPARARRRPELPLLDDVAGRTRPAVGRGRRARRGGSWTSRRARPRRGAPLLGGRRRRAGGTRGA